MPAVVALPALVAKVAFATVPVTFAPVIADSAEPLPLKKFALTKLPPAILPALMLPLTINDVNEPTLVIFG